MKIASVKNNIVLNNYKTATPVFTGKQDSLMKKEQSFLQSVVSFVKLWANDFSIGYSLGSCAYTKAEIDTIIKLKKLGFGEDACILGSKLNESKFQVALGLKELGYQDIVAVYSAKSLNLKKLERIKKLYNAGFRVSAISVGSSYSDKEIEMVLELKKLGFKDFDCERGAVLFKKNQLSSLKKLIDNGFGTPSLIQYAENVNEIVVDKAVYLKKIGFDDMHAIETSFKLNNSQIQAAIRLFNAGFCYESILSGALLNDEKLEKCLELNKNGYQDDFCIGAVDLDDKQLNNAKALLSSGFNSLVSVAVAKEKDDEEQLSKVMELRKLGVFETACLKLCDKVSLEQINKNKEVILELSKISQNNEVGSLFVEYFLTNEIDVSSKTFKERAKLIDILSYHSGVVQHNEKIKELFERTSISFDVLINQIKNIEQKTITLIEVNKEVVINFVKIFLANKNKNERILADFNFESFKEYGLPLKYSRKNFLTDLNFEILKLDSVQKKQLFEKLEISPIEKDGKIIGYDGVLNLNKLDRENIIESKIYRLIDKFINYNEINTYSEDVNNILNSLIKTYPEFINIIGKKQHKTHGSSLDIHILMVLSNAFKNKEYKNLSDIDKVKLKLAILFHDIAKTENKIDVSHPYNSAQYAKDLLRKLNLPDVVKNDIVELIKKHHWLKDYNTGEVGVEKTALLFRKKDEIKLARIMAEADLKGVSEGFWNAHKNALSTEKQNSINLALNKINSTGQIIYSSKIIKPELIPNIEYENEKYRVLNLVNIDENEDLSKYGFLPKVTKKNLRMFIHVFSPFNIKSLLDLNYYLKTDEEVVLSASYISPENKKTYYGEKFGVLLDEGLSDIVSATRNNQGSGTRKDLSDFVFNSIKDTRFRREIPNYIKKRLKINDEEYAELFNYVMGKKYLTQIKDEEKIVINNREFSAKDIKEIILSAQESIISKQQNEVCLYKPQIKGLIAKVEKINEVPKEFLLFAKQNDLPIFILGD